MSAKSINSLHGYKLFLRTKSIAAENAPDKCLRVQTKHNIIPLIPVLHQAITTYSSLGKECRPYNKKKISKIHVSIYKSKEQIHKLSAKGTERGKRNEHVAQGVNQVATRGSRGMSDWWKGSTLNPRKASF